MKVGLQVLYNIVAKEYKMGFRRWKAPLDHATAGSLLGTRARADLRRAYELKNFGKRCDRTMGVIITN
jgi:hypothetical protein